MYVNHSHIIYSAADIRRYLNGEMTRDEMYALEKQAAEDPFLADAIDGYTGITLEAAEADLTLLRSKITEGKQEAPVVYMKQPRGFKWWKQGIAAAVAGLVIFAAAMFLKSNKKEEQIAQVTPASASESKPVSDTTNAAKTTDMGKVTEMPEPKTTSPKAVFVSPDSLMKYYREVSQPVAAMESEARYYTTDDSKYIAAKPAPGAGGQADTVRQKVVDEGVAWGDLAKKEQSPRSSAPPPAPVQTEKNQAEEVVVTAQNRSQENTNMGNDRSRRSNEFNGVANVPAAKRKLSNYDKRDADMVVEDKKQEQFGVVTRNFFYNYRVTDNNGNSIPYTNIAIPADQLVTYSRSDGSFGLFSADSVLRVNVKAAGYEPKSFMLRNNEKLSSIVLNEESVAMKEKNLVIVGDQKNFALRKKDTKSVAKEEEPEPLDGWVTYDSYLANNIDIAGKTKGEVELSFEVNKKGEIKSVTVEKSLGAKEDQEAIRLVTQGPKWKSKKKKGKARVVVTF